MLNNTGIKITARNELMKMAAETYSVRRMKSHSGNTKSEAHASEYTDQNILATQFGDQ